MASISFGLNVLTNHWSNMKDMDKKSTGSKAQKKS